MALSSVKILSLYLLVILFSIAGINHFLNPDDYLKIMPPYLPFHLPLVYLSGALEILFSLLLIPIASRKVAAWLLILLLIAVFPGNVQMMINYKKMNHPHYWLTIIRLPLQLLLVWWVYQFTKYKK